MLIPLLPMIISDYRDRTVHVLWLAVFGAAAVLSACFCMGWKILIFNILLNSSVLLLMALFLALYFKLRKKKLSGMIGEGDCVFLFLLAPYFQLHNYLMFLVVSSCAALVSWLLVFRRDGSIPLISVYGKPTEGRFLSPEGTDFESRSLPSYIKTAEYTRYMVNKPFPVSEGQAAPFYWFNSSGGVTQYYLKNDISYYIEKGYIKIIK